jgi:hypothetical protein
MCGSPLGAGTATVRQDDPVLAAVEVEEVVEVEAVADPADVLVVDDELELLPHPAIARAAAAIGNAFRTGAKQSTPDRPGAVSRGGSSW